MKTEYYRSFRLNIRKIHPVKNSRNKMNFESYYETSRKEINNRLTDILKEEVEDQDFHDMLHYAIKGGKRFRPTLTLLAFDMLNGENRHKALTHSAIIELVHEASVAQDDALDYDKMRRGKDSVWMRLFKRSIKGLNNLFPKGLPQELSPKVISNLMAGNVVGADGILALGFNLVKDPEVMKAISEGVMALSQGAIKESENMLKAKFFGATEDNYKRIIKGKTASLFAMSTQVGAISADSTRKQIENARKLGLHLGMCYQIADDLSEGDLNQKIDGESLIIEQAKLYDQVLNKFGKNKYRDMFESVVPFMINKLSAEENYGKKLVRKSPEVFEWVSR